MQDYDFINDDELLFSGEESDGLVIESLPPWRVLIVDDEPDVHSMTRMVLGDFVFEGRSLEFLSAYSGEESLLLLQKEPDVSVVLLDVVMETNTAGLDVAQQIRSQLNNQFIRIILRTGQPGFAPEYKVITELDINDYWQKAELTSQRLTTSMTTALRSYRDLLKIEHNRVSLAQLAMSVAHQIRNRTMTINGFASLASRKLDADSDAVRYLDTISEEVGRLEMIVDSVSDFAAISNCDHSEVRVLDAMESALDLGRAYATTLGKDVEFDVHFANVTVDAEPDLFTKVIEELLRNAIFFSSDLNPEVRIAVKVDSEFCSIEIADNGPGVAEEDLPFIFDPFFTRRPDAVGMGLSIVNRVVSGYNWSVDVFRADGGGAVFYLKIPL